MSDTSGNNLNKKNISIPGHVGIIIDGNRQWAKERNLPLFEGHVKGFEKINMLPFWFFKRGIKNISVLVLSSESWNSSPEEIGHLMKLIKHHLEKLSEIAIQNNFRILISGHLDELPGDLPECCTETINNTKNGTAGCLHLGLNYDGRAEIVEAVRKIIKNGIELEQIHSGMILKYLYNGGLGDVDIMVRTSRSQCATSFLLWQAANSQLLFLRKYWPEFAEEDVDKIIADYSAIKLKE